MTKKAYDLETALEDLTHEDYRVRNEAYDWLRKLDNSTSKIVSDVDGEIETPFSIAYSNFSAALDPGSDYESIDEALDSYYVNAMDTAEEYRLPTGDVDFYWNRLLESRKLDEAKKKRAADYDLLEKVATIAHSFGHISDEDVKRIGEIAREWKTSYRAS